MSSGRHLVHRVGERHAVIKVDERRSNRPSPPEERVGGTGSAPSRARSPCRTAPVCSVKTSSASICVLEDARDRSLVEQPDTVDRSAAHERGVDPRDRARVPDSVRGRDLGHARRARRRLGRVERPDPRRACAEERTRLRVGEIVVQACGGGTSSATRSSCTASSPMWKSAPSGSATSSRKNVPRVRPSTRRTSSPWRNPCVTAWYPTACPAPTTAPARRGWRTTLSQS